LNIAPTQVHGLSERAVQSTRRDWAWLVEGAEGWERYVAPSEVLPGRTEELDPAGEPARERPRTSFPARPASAEGPRGL
ncbi:MAG: hypothetical protein ACRENE_33380, partial [Polyangiaceae bacterium]